MEYRDYIKLGANHHLLYAGMVKDPLQHEATLDRLIRDKRLEVLDLWIPDDEEIRRRETWNLKESGKEIIYNIGTRAGKPSAHPATLDPEKRRYSLDFYMRELDRALEAGAGKIVTNSGADVPDQRAAAFEALVDFYLKLCRHVGPDVMIMIEPTDREVDKRKLIGPSSEAVDLARRIHEGGCLNFASMVDQTHVPLMGETIEQAMRITRPVMGHLHLGNCILKDPSHPLFGDKHIGWGIAGSEYGADDVAELIELGLESGYFRRGDRGSASFEMRPYPDLSPEESLDRYFSIFEQAWEKASKHIGVID